LETDVAMSQGQIGYWLQQAIDDELKLAGIDKEAATLVTQVVVKEDDPAFGDPSKPIGPFYEEEEAKKLAAERGWTVKADADRGWRRVVPSPKPVDIVEKDIIKELVESGVIVIASGGGGIPVVEKGGIYEGVDAVIDKDFAASHMAKLLDADVFIALTAVKYATINFATPEVQNIEGTTIAQMEQYIEENQFSPGSMLPKVQATLAFVKAKPTNEAIITSPDNLTDAINGNSGTIIRNT
jgi:carbamate kinase